MEEHVGAVYRCTMGKLRWGWAAWALVTGLLVACGGDEGGAPGASPVGEDGGPGGPPPTPTGVPDGGGPQADGGGGGDGGDGGPGYDVAALPGLVLWLDQASAGTSPTTWSDKSGKGHDAKTGGGCASPDRNAPVLKGIKALGFHETECFSIADHPDFQWGTGDFYVATVAHNNYNDPTGAGGTTFTYPDGRFTRRRFGEMFSKIPSGFGPGPTVVFNDWTDRSYKWVGSVDVTQMVKTPAPGRFAEPAHLVSFRRKGGVLELRIDGVVKSTMADAGAPIDVSAVGTPVAIGGRPGLTNFVGGIWEVVAVKGSLDDAPMTALENHMKAKYGL